MDELQYILKQLDESRNVEDIFGPGPKEKAKKVYLKLIHAMHPDKFPTASDEIIQLATSATAELNLKWIEAEKRFDAGVYGESKPTPSNGPTIISTRKCRYTIIRKLATGGTATTFLSTRESGGTAIEVILKVPNSPQDNDLMEHERDTLLKIRKSIKETELNDTQKVGLFDGFPALLESVKVGDRVMNVFAWEEGWYTLEQIRRKHSQLSLRQFTFIFNKILLIIDTSNKMGFCHGAIVPNHVMIHAVQHRGRLVDWTLAQPIDSPGKLTYWDDRWNRFMAPEVCNQHVSNRSSDVYSAAMCGVYLLGGAKSMEVDVPESFRVVLNKCLQPKRGSRYRTPLLAFDDFAEVVQKEIGPPQYVELDMS